MNSPGRKTYLDAPSWKAMTFICLFFAAATVVVAWHAAGNDRPIRIFRFISLEPAGATRLYFGVSIFCAVFSLVGLAGLWKRFVFPQEVVVDDYGLEVPKGYFTRDTVRVPYDQVASFSVSEAVGERTLRIDLKDGTRRHLAQNQLTRKNAFEEIVEALSARAGLVPPPGAP